MKLLNHSVSKKKPSIRSLENILENILNMDIEYTYEVSKSAPKVTCSIGYQYQGYYFKVKDSASSKQEALFNTVCKLPKSIKNYV